MDRRSSLKLIATGAIATGAVVAGCKPGEEKKPVTGETAQPEFNLDRSQAELVSEKALIAKGRFFNDHEMATIAILSDIIIPKDDVSGSATDAKVPEFIDFIVRDMPQHQIPMQGGLRWLDLQCMKTWEKPFTDITPAQRIELVDQIAYPAKVKPALKQGATFFSLMRNLTASGFYTTAIGIRDIGYAGNTPNQWKGVPEDVLKQYNLAYTQKEIDECVSFT